VRTLLSVEVYTMDDETPDDIKLMVRDALRRLGNDFNVLSCESAPLDNAAENKYEDQFSQQLVAAIDPAQIVAHVIEWFQSRAELQPNDVQVC
jgi:hypothetical protein